MKGFTVLALDNFPMIEAGDDIAKIIVEMAEKNGLSIEDGDIIVIAQKIISKAENRVVSLRDVVPSKRAKDIAKRISKNSRLAELVLQETSSILKVASEVFLVEDKRGLICINAGIDKSNIKGRENFALLPENPDKSAERCRLEIGELTGKNVAVIICDTYSRPFRRGQVNFAIGVAGIGLFKDYRGKEDLFGQVLKVKNIAVVDEIAASAELLMGQAKEARPVVILKGLTGFSALPERTSIRDLFISREEDLFRNAM